MKKASLNPDTFIDARGKSDEMRLEEAEGLRDYSSNLVLAGEFLESQIPMRDFLLDGLIPKRSISIINGNRGAGKSWLGLAIANEVIWGGEVGPWKVISPVDVILVDAEMEVSIIHERLKMLNVGRDLRDAPNNLYLYMEGQAWEKGLGRTSILNATWRKWLLDVMKENTDIGLLILDNLASLAPGIDENDKMSFDVVNRWLLELRFMGVSVIMIHHLGKSGVQRGTSAHEDHVDLALDLKGKQGAAYCRFICEVSKDRTCATTGKRWELELREDKQGRKTFEYSELGVYEGIVPELGTAFLNTSTKTVEKVIRFLDRHPEASARVVANACGISKNSVKNYRKLWQEGHEGRP